MNRITGRTLSLMAASLLLITACGSDALEEDQSPSDESIPVPRAVTQPDGHSTHTSPEGILVECADFDGDVECWVVAYP